MTAETTARARYKAAHRLARRNRRDGLWLHNPIRIADGYPGLWVEASGQVVEFAGFNAGPYPWNPPSRIK